MAATLYNAPLSTNTRTITVLTFFVYKSINNLFILCKTYNMKWMALFLFSLCCCLGCSQGAGNGAASATPPPPFTTSTACVLSQLAYKDTPQLQIQQYLPGWSVVWHGHLGSNYAFAASNGHYTAVAIRGSLLEFTEKALDNWLYQDMNIVEQVAWPYTTGTSKAVVSKGAYDAWKNIDAITDTSSEQTLWQYLERSDTSRPLYFTGHSLGGKLAILYGAYAHWKYRKAGRARQNLNVISFAAPAAGNQAFADGFDSTFPRAIRVENANDLVPKFPCTDRMESLGRLFDKGPSAEQIEMGYKNFTVKLSTAFTMANTALTLLLLKGNDPYVQTSKGGQLLNIPLSGKYPAQTITDWFAEAAYQHGIAQYARQLGAPVIKE
jgi:triacylglycerol lipase